MIPRVSKTPCQAEQERNLVLLRNTRDAFVENYCIFTKRKKKKCET